MNRLTEAERAAEELEKAARREADDIVKSARNEAKEIIGRAEETAAQIMADYEKKVKAEAEKMRGKFADSQKDENKKLNAVFAKAQDKALEIIMEELA